MLPTLMRPIAPPAILKPTVKAGNDTEAQKQALRDDLAGFCSKITKLELQRAQAITPEEKEPIQAEIDATRAAINSVNAQLAALNQ